MESRCIQRVSGCFEHSHLDLGIVNLFLIQCRETNFRLIGKSQTLHTLLLTISEAPLP